MQINESQLNPYYSRYCDNKRIKEENLHQIDLWLLIASLAIIDIKWYNLFCDDDDDDKLCMNRHETNSRTRYMLMSIQSMHMK